MYDTIGGSAGLGTVKVPIRIAAQFAHSYIWRMTAAIDPKRIRERVGLSQAEFAARYRLSRDTVRGWEAGRPLSGSARILLTLIDRAPDQIADILAEEVPNAETVAAMQAARCGEGTDFATLDDLFADLNAPDH